MAGIESWTRNPASTAGPASRLSSRHHAAGDLLVTLDRLSGDTWTACGSSERRLSRGRLPASISQYPARMPIQPLPIPLAHLIDSSVRLSWPEAVALARSLAEATGRCDARQRSGPGALDDYGLDAGGRVIGLIGACRPVPLGELALFLGQLLPAAGATPDSRAPGGVHLAIGRALGLVEAPPLDSVERFSDALARFERGDRCQLLRAVFERCRTAAGTERDAAARHQADVVADEEIGRSHDDPSPTPSRRATAMARRLERRTTVPSVDVLRRLLREADRASFERMSAAGPPDAGRGRRHNGASADALRRLLREADQRNYELSQARRRGPRHLAEAALALAVLVGFAVGIAERDATWRGTSRRPAATVLAGSRSPRGAAASTGRHDAPVDAPQPGAGVEAQGARPTPSVRATPGRSEPDAGATTARNTTNGLVPPGVDSRPAESVTSEPAQAGHLVQALDVGRRPIFSPSFAADGSAVFFDERDRGGTSLMQARASADGQMHVVSVVSDGAENYHPQLSPDGQTIAFDSDRDGVRGVYLASRDGHNVRRVSGPGYAAVPTWSPDGTRLAFIRAEDGHPRVWNLWCMDMQSGKLSRLTSYPYGESWGASWFPDGRRICYSHENDLIVLDQDTNASRTYRSPRPGRLVRTPAVSPDGRYVVFQVHRDGAWLLDLRDGDMRKVLDDPSAEEFAWAPNGRQIAFHSRRGGQWGLWFMAPGR